jgi:hypothetical protein
MQWALKQPQKNNYLINDLTLKKILTLITVCLFFLTTTNAQQTKEEQEIINISKRKWQWMAEKNTDSLAVLFDDKSMYVHMGGSWGKEQELNVIKTGGIWYKKADIHSVSVNIIDNTAILLNKITLLAVVGGNEVTNPFMVTEVYVKHNNKWMLGSLSFTKLLVPEEAKK